MKHLIVPAVLLVACTGLPGMVQAQDRGRVDVDLGNHILRPNQADQFVELTAQLTSPAMLSEGDFILQITAQEGEPTPDALPALGVFFEDFGVDDNGDPIPAPPFPNNSLGGLQFSGPGYILNDATIAARSFDPTFWIGDVGEITPQGPFAISYYPINELPDGTVEEDIDFFTTESGTLFSIAIDTTGVFSGTFDFISLFDLSRQPGGFSVALPIPTFPINGTITIAPPGDYNADGTVGPEDYDVWANSYGSTTNLDADGNGDSIVDAADYTIWRDNLPPSPAAVPEPSTLCLLPLLGATRLMVTRRTARARLA